MSALADRLLVAAEAYESAVEIVGQRDAIHWMIQAIEDRIGQDGWANVFAAEGVDRVANQHVAIVGGNGPRWHRVGLAEALRAKFADDGEEEARR